MFRFKQFSVNHSKSAMKVGTDSVLLGSWTPIFNPKKILDIGAGTGILSLMLAQRTDKNTLIDAVEIDFDAFQEASENILNSKWNHRIKLYFTDIEEFKIVEKYDLIISNPPFFTDNFISPNEKRQKARSEKQLSFAKLIKISKKLLSENGYFSVIIPFKEGENFIEICKKNGLFLHSKTKVKGRENTDFIRLLLLFSVKEVEKIFENQLVIEKERHVYTSEYIQLTKDFYLKM